MDIILASTSPYRRALLQRLQLPFSCVAPPVDEARLPGEAPAAMAGRLALAKAESVARLHPEALVINVAGEASWLMNMQEMGTAIQFRAPVKQFILNNERLGMVRQWQQLLHGERYSQSWSESLPDFAKLAEAFGCKGIRCADPKHLDEAIMEMLDYDGPVIFDCLVEKHENCYPMIPSGKPHNEMLLGDTGAEDAIGAKGAVLV